MAFIADQVGCICPSDQANCPTSLPVSAAVRRNARRNSDQGCRRGGGPAACLDLAGSNRRQQGLEHIERVDRLILVGLRSNAEIELPVGAKDKLQRAGFDDMRIDRDAPASLVARGLDCGQRAQAAEPLLKRRDRRAQACLIDVV